ncbi:NAD(P)-dependent alcohol dehydrogenase [Kutzneria chonburiensis]|uniref:NAD(P)-dependent alcohol dehydrogenase n=1 Tax=Kutzneria chonburiensis TaxID=1483604 RepID=UPI00235F2913|nr:NAD(P)-dependent alcohol dehydrogenase [Kutzneria chonburiensis]
MRAIVSDRYGSLDVLQLKDIERPRPGPGEVAVRVRAAGVDPSIWHLTSGQPYLIRLLGFGLRRPRRLVPGLDLAGTIEEIGPGVTDLRPGDEVFGTADGSFAEYAIAKASRVVAKPANLAFDQAAAVPVSACTALKGLLSVQSGQRLLVIGAGGGVGSYAVQLAKARQAHVTGVCSTAKTDLVKMLGADEIVDYKRNPSPAATMSSWTPPATDRFPNCANTSRPRAHWSSSAAKAAASSSAASPAPCAPPCSRHS